MAVQPRILPATTVEASTTPGQSPSVGTSLRYAREDHVHGTPAAGAGSGDVVGPSSSTDNAVARFDGTGGKTIQNSPVTVDDNGTINIPSGQTYNINGSPHTHDYALASHGHSQSDVSGLVSDLTAKASAADLTAHTNLTTTAHGGIAPASHTHTAIATGFSIPYTFSTSTGPNPSSGYLHYNNSTPASATMIYMSESDVNSVSVDEVLDRLLPGNYVRVFSLSNPAAYHLFQVSGAFTSGSGVDAVPVSYLYGVGTFSNNDPIAVALTNGEEVFEMCSKIFARARLV